MTGQLIAKQQGGLKGATTVGNARQQGTSYPFAPPSGAAPDTVFKQTVVGINSGTDAPHWTLGIEASTYVPGSITAVYWCPPVMALTPTVGWRIYQGHVGEGGSLLASGNLPSYVGNNTWQRFVIPSLDVTAKNFQVCLFTSTQGDYNYRNFSGWPLDDGIIRAKGTSYNDTGDARPTHEGFTLSYMIDFEFTPS